MARTLVFAFVVLWACQAVPAQVAEPSTLAPGQSVEREIAGGQSHDYRIALQAGQFVRVVVEQKAVNVALVLADRDGKKVVEVNLTAAGGLESLSAEAAASGDYRLTVRAAGSATLAGSYQVRLEVKAAATAQDRQRIAAEALLHEANELRKQGGKTAEQTIDKLQQALPVWRELGDQYWAAWSLWNIGVAYNSLSRYEKAIEYLEQALAIYREVKNRAGEGNTLNTLGGAYRSLSRYEKATECYEQALAIAREVKDRVGEGTALNGLGNIYYSVSRYDKAIEHYEQALAIAREVKNQVGEGAALANLGGSYRYMGRYEKAIEYYEQSLAIYREVKNRVGEGYTLSSLGSAYYDLSRYDKSIEYHEQALAIAREVKDRVGEGTALNSLGDAYRSLSRYEKAIEYYEQSLAIYREVKNRVGEGNTLSSLGSVYYGLGRYEKAIEYHEQALAISREVKYRVDEISTLNSLGSDYYSLSRYEKASEYYQQELAIARETKNRVGEAPALYNLARAERAQGNLTAACAHVEESLKISESLRSDILSPESRASFLANAQSSYHLYTDILMRQHKAEPTKGFDALAVEVSERQRARSLLDLLSETRTDMRQGVDAALIERERRLAKQLDDKAQQLAQAAKPEQSAALKQEVSQLEIDLERAQVAIRNANPHYAALVQPQPLKLREIQAQLDADTLLLEYSLGEEHSYLWAISKDSLISYELPKEGLIDESARQVYELLSARSVNKPAETAAQRTERIAAADSRLPVAAQTLSRMLLSPAALQIDGKRLVIVADGALQYIPFAMLPDPGMAKQQPLIIGHEVVSLPSASALAIQRKELDGRQLAPKTLAVIADPVFDRSDPRVEAPAAEATKEPKVATAGVANTNADARSLEHIAETSDVGGRFVIRRLPFTREEAESLLALTPKSSSFVAMDFRANRANVLAGDLSQYRYIHFATHGLLDSERPGLSALVLSTVDADGEPQDGFLRANDIYNMKLPAELVVLSACQTGLGKEVKGEGLVGLTRGFMYAGARRVVVSLWSVNDKATADLMTSFYRGMLKDNERPAAALRAAQIEMWKQKKWQSPYYWAAFTMQGEWR